MITDAGEPTGRGGVKDRAAAPRLGLPLSRRASSLLRPVLGCSWRRGGGLVSLPQQQPKLDMEGYSSSLLPTNSAGATISPRFAAVSGVNWYGLLASAMRCRRASFSSSDKASKLALRALLR